MRKLQTVVETWRSLGWLWLAAFAAATLSLGCVERHVPFGALTWKQLKSTNELDIFEALHRIDDDAANLPDEVRVRLRELVADRRLDEVTRAMAASRLARSDDDLVALVTNPRESSLLRAAVANVLLKKGQDAEKRLLTIVEDKKKPEKIRWTIFYALAASSKPMSMRAVATNTTLAGAMRRFAVASLGTDTMRDPISARLLVSFLADADAELRLAATEAATSYRQLDLDESLRGQLDERLGTLAFEPNEYPEVRALAFEGISRLSKLPSAPSRAAALFQGSDIPVLVREHAAKFLLHDDRGDDPALAASFVAVLRDEKATLDLRRLAAELLQQNASEAGQLAQALAPLLRDLRSLLASKSADTQLRREILDLVGRVAGADGVRPELELHIQYLEDLATNPKEELELQAAILKVFGKLADTSPPRAAFLRKLIHDDSKEPALRSAAIEALSSSAMAYLKPEELQSLMTSTDDRIAVSSIEALSKLGSAGGRLAEDLVKLATVGSLGVRIAAIKCLKATKVTSDAVVKVGVDILTDPDPNKEQSALAKDASQLSPNEPPPMPDDLAVGSLVPAAEELLLGLGVRGSRALPGLAEGLRNGDLDAQARARIGATVGRIATILGDAKEVSAIDALQGVLGELKRNQLTDAERSVTRAIALLNAAHAHKLLYAVTNFIQTHIPLAIGLLYIIVALLLSGVLLIVSPLSILRVDRAIAIVPEVTLPKWLGEYTLSIRPLAVVTLFRYHRRVLDAWVKQVRGKACAQFSRKRSVADRSICVPMAVAIDGKSYAALDAQQLKTLMKASRFTLSIEGEGGAGKSTLAFNMALRGMSEDPGERGLPFLSIPVVLDSDLAANDTLIGWIARELATMVGSQTPFDAKFVEQLVARQRIVVLVDRLSEMNPDSRQKVLGDIDRVPVSALVVTSRKDETLPGAAKAVIQPLRIQGSSVSSFLSDFLQRAGHRKKFDDPTFFEVCRGLTMLADGRDITPLLATMYAQYALARQIGSSPRLDKPPMNVPELISRYVDAVTEPVASEFASHDVHEILRVIAWECIRETWSPGSANQDKVAKSLGDDGEKKLDFTIDRLKLVQRSGIKRDDIRFSVDPLAEYLGAMRLFETDGQQWSRDLQRLEDAILGGSVGGFVRVIDDCLKTTEITKFVASDVCKRLLQAIEKAAEPTAKVA